MNCLMGIDLGTSSVKVLITDEKGNLLGLGSAGYIVETPKPGYAQQDPVQWWEKTKQAVAAALHEADVSPDRILSIGFSGQMHGMVLLDADKNVICPAIIHLDQRSAGQRAEILETAGDLVREELLNQPSTGMLICSLLWVKENRPELYDKVSYVMSPKDYIRFRLTGIISSEPADASATLAFSIKRGNWCRELIHRMGLKDDIWPDIFPSVRIVGTVTPHAAKETGLSVQTIVAGGTGDCSAAFTGNGVVEEGTMACNIGTSSQLAVVVRTPKTDPGMVNQLWCHSMEGAFLYQGGALNGGGTLGWLKDKILRTADSFEKLDLKAGGAPVGSGGVVFLPYLAGERTPFNNPDAKGVFFGLQLQHDDSHLIRAVLEGVMYNLAACKQYFDSMGFSQTKLISSGGGARGAVWRQIQADMLGMPVYRTRTKEEACLGAAMTGAVGAGLYPDIPSACREMVKMREEVTEPIPENTAFYREGLQKYMDLYEAVKDLYGGR